MLKKSRLQNIFIVSFIIIWVVLSISLASEVFNYIHDIPLFGNILINRLLYIFFFSLMVFTFLSSLTIALSRINGSKEYYFLATTSQKIGSVFLFSFFEVTLMTGWAILFFSIPLHIGFFLSQGISIQSILFFSAILVPLIIISSFCGSLIAMMMVCINSKFQEYIKKGVIIYIFFSIFQFLKNVDKKIVDISDLNLFIKDILELCKFADNELYPSSISAKIYYAFFIDNVFNISDYLIILFYLLVVISVAYVFLSFASALIINNYYSQNVRKRKLSLINLLIANINKPARAVILKDLQILLRDPAQYSQLIIFILMIVFYYVNINNSYIKQLSFFWRNIIIHLNIASIEMAICAFATRFFYPQISLEGSSMWIIKMSSFNSKEFLHEKRIFAVIFCLLTSVIMNSFTLYVVGTSLYEYSFMIALSSLMAIFIGASAVNFGAIYADFSAGSIAEIVSGFGPTTNFLISILFISIGVAGSLFINKLMSTQSILNFNYYLTFIVVLIILIYVFLKFNSRVAEKRINELFH